MIDNHANNSTYYKIKVLYNSSDILACQPNTLQLSWNRCKEALPHTICLCDFIEKHPDLIANLYMSKLSSLLDLHHNNEKITKSLLYSKLFECSDMSSDNFDSRLKLLAVSHIKELQQVSDICFDEICCKNGIDKQFFQRPLNIFDKCSVFFRLIFFLIQSFLFLSKFIFLRTTKIESVRSVKKKLTENHNSILFLGYGAHYLPQSLCTKYWFGLADALDEKGLSAIWIDIHVNGATKRNEYINSHNKILLDSFITKFEAFLTVKVVFQNFFYLTHRVVFRKYNTYGFWMDDIFIRSLVGKTALEAPIYEKCLTNIFDVYNYNPKHIIYLMEGQSWERVLQMVVARLNPKKDGLTAYIHASAYLWDLRFRSVFYFYKKINRPNKVLVSNSETKNTISAIQPDLDLFQVEPLRGQMNQIDTIKSTIRPIQKVVILGDYIGHDLRSWIKIINDMNSHKFVEYTIREHPLTPNPIRKNEIQFPYLLSLSTEIYYGQYDLYLVGSTSTTTIELLAHNLEVANVVSDTKIFKSITNGKCIEKISCSDELEEFLDGRKKSLDGNLKPKFIQYTDPNLSRWRRYLDQIENQEVDIENELL